MFFWHVCDDEHDRTSFSSLAHGYGMAFNTVAFALGQESCGSIFESVSQDTYEISLIIRYFLFGDNLQHVYLPSVEGECGAKTGRAQEK